MSRLASLLGALFGCVLALLVVGPGCSAAPADRLRTAIDLNNAAVAALDGARAAHERAVAADFKRRAADCQQPARAARQACLTDAAAAAILAAAPDRTKLTDLTLLEQRVAAALAAAEQCRKDRLACETDELRAGEGPLSELRAELARLTAGDGGAP